jgi:hypothetical protein
MLVRSIGADTDSDSDTIQILLELILCEFNIPIREAQKYIKGFVCHAVYTWDEEDGDQKLLSH